MDNVARGISGGLFWLALAFIVMAIVWLLVKKQQMKHELTLKLLDRGKDADPELLALARQLMAARPDVAPQAAKPLSEQHLEGGSFMTLLFVVSGMVMIFIGALRDDTNWILILVGALAFIYGNLCWRGAYQRYLAEKAEEKAEAEARAARGE